jgi:GTP-binding protein Era
MAHKAGFVNIIGNPNVGKSTLMNAFVERLYHYVKGTNDS